MNDAQIDALIAAINRLAAAHEHIAATSKKSAEIAECALTKQTELLSGMHDELHDGV